ncbi:hypothetical protein [Microbacterium sp.]|uniref:hypothetical protein n=1 Tax=Microbacterium sp. TaxID=51671 RepID=UPI000927B417|nr:hypothetical protein [Microbacterium sp.]MBN9193995.1 hypothetical protein [Microbacterium sp.]OJU57122.1 MAG: hypothetical protein BGO04_03850 [Microbacterium sp. 70-38]
MIIDFVVDEKYVCGIRIFEDMVPNTTEEFRRRLPIRTKLQHATLVGDQLFAVLPFVIPMENLIMTEDLAELRRKDKGTVAGTVVFYSPRQVFGVTYSDDLAVEPLANGYIGEVIDGLTELALVGEETWRKQDKFVELRIRDES